MSSKKKIGRVIEQHPTRVTSEMLRAELSATKPDDFPSLLQRDREYQELYDSHPVTRAALEDGLPRERIVPLSVYFDGVQYTQNENFLGFYVTNLRTQRLRLVWLLRFLASNMLQQFYEQILGPYSVERRKDHLCNRQLL